MKFNIYIILSFLWIICSLPGCKAQSKTVSSTLYLQDSIAERMLIYQRHNGGWPQPKGDPINYQKILSSSLVNTLLSEKDFLDATIDDKATTREINGLVEAFQKTKNPAYIKAAENGIKYLLTAQNQAGGWGQFFPDSSGYHVHITYNDNAMIDVMYVMKNTAEATNGFGAVDKSLVPAAQKAVEKGIECILKTQVVQNGKLTAWCAQHNRNTLKPAKARMFELPSLSGNESVGIIKFLMTIDKPSDQVKAAIKAAVAWLESVKIVGIKTKDIPDASQPKGKDRIVIEDPSSAVWARFYELETNKPFFAGRNSVVKYSLSEIENERRVGYAYYGTWPAQLLTKDYPEWVKRVGKE